jgi:uncharacterized protein
MGIAVSYPGVYIEEIPSGVRTVTGVATSIAAFVGRTLRGPTDIPQTINSYADFERVFGGLWTESTLSYALRDFFLNGGGQALVVRLFKADAGTGKAKLIADADKLIILEAVSPGAWGNGLRAMIDTNTAPSVETGLGLKKSTDVFNLTVIDTAPGGRSERFINLTVVDSPRRIDKVLAAGSSLVRWDSAESLPKDSKPVKPKPSTEDSKGGDDGLTLTSAEYLPATGAASKSGLYALEQADLFNLLCLPPFTVDTDIPADLLAPAAAYCEKRRALLLVDPPTGWVSKDAAKAGLNAATAPYPGISSKNAAIYFPRLRQPDPLRGNQILDFVPCGAVAGVIARTDAQRGVWKAPAGLDANLVGVPQLSVPLTDAETGELNPLGINCLRAMPATGRVVWGARTLQGDDRLASEWKYVPVRRLALYIEESLYRGTQWVVFEPNDEPLWAQIRLNLGSFMHNLFRQGAFQGVIPQSAYFVKCDSETTTQNDVDQGIVNIVVGFAPLKPAEFVVIRLQQIAGQLQA